MMQQFDDLLMPMHVRHVHDRAYDLDAIAISLEATVRDRVCKRQETEELPGIMRRMTREDVLCMERRDDEDGTRTIGKPAASPPKRPAASKKRERPVAAAAAAVVAVVATAPKKKPKPDKGLEDIAAEIAETFAAKKMTASDIVKEYRCLLPLKTAATIMQIMCKKRSAETATLHGRPAIAIF
jgi:hypothetical protein